MNSKNLFKGIALVAGVTVCCAILSFAIMAWTEPGAVPPEGNVAAPINTGSSNQSKTGNLGFQTGTESGNPLYYWVSRIGQSLVFLNNAGQSALEIGQDKNVVATTKLSAPEICLNGVCRTTWPDGGGGDTNFSISYSGSIPLPAGNKRVFVTETEMPFDTMTSETAADAYCQQQADSQNYNGTFKALAYFGNRSDLNSVLPADNSFWKRGDAVSDGMYTWSLVATDRSDFFTASPGGAYLSSPMGYDSDFGAATGFAPKGDGTYNLFDDAMAKVCINSGATRYKGPCYYGNDNHYYCVLGRETMIDSKWATACGVDLEYVKTCNNFYICRKYKTFFLGFPRNIYCIEQ